MPRITVKSGASRYTSERVDDSPSSESSEDDDNVIHGSPSEDEDDDDDYDDQRSWDHLSEELSETTNSRTSRARSSNYAASSRAASISRPPPVRSAPRPKPARAFTTVPEQPGRRSARQARPGAGTREPSQRRRSFAGAEEEPYYPPAGYPPTHPYPGWSHVPNYPGQPSSAFDSGGYAGYDGYANPFTSGNDDYMRQRGQRMSMPFRPGNELMVQNPYGHPYYPYGPPPGAGPSAAAAAPTADGQLRMISDILSKQAEATQAARDQAVKDKLDAETNALKAKAKAEEDKLSALTALIEKHNKEQLAREKEMKDERAKEKADREAAERAAADAKKAAEEKNKELKAAGEAAKKKAEEEMAKKQAEEKAKWDKEMEELKKKAAETEEAKKKAEEEVKTLKPKDDMTKPPIKFKDAVGRKFSFPWHLCKTWKGMENLINQAFLHVDGIGQHVHDGHYDLIGPNNEIILPQVWETMVKPDWDISMHMWPMPEPPKHPMMLPPGMVMPPPIPGKSGKAAKPGKSSKTKAGVVPAPPPGMMPPPPPMPGGMMDFPPGMAFPPGMMMPPGMEAMMAQPPMAMAVPVKKKKKKEPSTLAMFFAGQKPSRGDSLKSGKKLLESDEVKVVVDVVGSSSGTSTKKSSKDVKGKGKAKVEVTEVLLDDGDFIGDAPAVVAVPVIEVAPKKAGTSATKVKKAANRKSVAGPSILKTPTVMIDEGADLVLVDTVKPSSGSRAAKPSAPNGSAPAGQQDCVVM